MGAFRECRTGWGTSQPDSVVIGSHSPWWQHVVPPAFLACDEGASSSRRTLQGNRTLPDSPLVWCWDLDFTVQASEHPPHGRDHRRPGRIVAAARPDRKRPGRDCLLGLVHTRLGVPQARRKAPPAPGQPGQGLRHRGRLRLSRPPLPAPVDRRAAGRCREIGARPLSHAPPYTCLLGHGATCSLGPRPAPYSPRRGRHYPLARLTRSVTDSITRDGPERASTDQVAVNRSALVLSTKAVHASRVKISFGPAGSLESRTAMASGRWATSMHAPLALLWLLLRHWAG